MFLRNFRGNRVITSGKSLTVMEIHRAINFDTKQEKISIGM